MLERSEANTAGHPVTARVARWLQWTALVAAALMALQSAGYVFLASGYDIPRGKTGFSPLVSCDAECFCVIDYVTRESPADRAGILPGDTRRLDRFW